jgi:hypothetical protein
MNKAPTKRATYCIKDSILPENTNSKDSFPPISVSSPKRSRCLLVREIRALALNEHTIHNSFSGILIVA